MDKRTLKSYLSLCREIEILRQERAELLNSGLGAANNDGLPHGSRVSNPTADIAARAASIAAELSQKLNECIDLRLQIEQAVNALNEPRERELMRRRYIEGQRWEQVAYEMNYTLRHVTRLHGRILQRMRVK
mgnify:FL=1